MPKSLLLPQFATTKNWLVFRLSHLGDVVLTTGVLTHLGERYTMRFHVLTKEVWGDVFVQHPFVDKIVPFTAKKETFGEEVHNLRALAAQYTNWGLLDLHGTLRSRMLAFFWHGPVARYPKMGLERRMLLALPTTQIKKKLCALRVPQRYALALESAPTPAKDLLPRIVLTDEERVAGLARTCAVTTTQQKPVALHPFATHAWKSWPRAVWLSLAAQLREKGIPFVVIGRGEPLFADQPFDLTNKTSLRETCAVLASCRSLVTGDSGPMHLATAVGTPVVCMFGPTVEEWGFYPSLPHDIILEQPLPCRPCSLHGKGRCPRDGECLRGITPAMVIAALAEQENAVVQRYGAACEQGGLA